MACASAPTASRACAPCGFGYEMRACHLPSNRMAVEKLVRHHGDDDDDVVARRTRLEQYVMDHAALRYGAAVPLPAWRSATDVLDDAQSPFVRLRLGGGTVQYHLLDEYDGRATTRQLDRRVTDTSGVVFVVVGPRLMVPPRLDDPRCLLMLPASLEADATFQVAPSHQGDHRIALDVARALPYLPAPLARRVVVPRAALRDPVGPDDAPHVVSATSALPPAAAAASASARMVHAELRAQLMPRVLEELRAELTRKLTTTEPESFGIVWAASDASAASAAEGGCWTLSDV